MKRILILAVVLGMGAGGYFLYTRGGAQANTTNASGGGRGRAGGAPRGGGGGGDFGGGFGGGFGGRGGGPRPTQMTVEVGAVKRADMSENVTVVGNLIGAQTVDAVARVAGRLDTINVRLGDQVRRGQQVAKVEDREIIEQIKQAQASYDVSGAQIRQREADLRLAQSNLERNKSLLERQLISRQTFDDTDSRFQAAQAQLDLSRAQYAQAAARLDELKLSLGNTIVTSPVNGFVSKRALDPGAWVTTNTSFMSFVDITTVRLVANVIEKDLRRVAKGLSADVGVDAYPGEVFKGRIARISPVLDPATRTAQIEVEIDNAQYRLKPGMYAKVDLTVEHHPNALVVPTNSLVDLGGKRGVFKPGEGPDGNVARFHPVQIGLSNVNLSEIASGLSEGERVVTTGAGALREGDKLLLAGAGPQPGGGGRGGSGGRGGGRRGGGAGDGGGAGRSGGGGAEPQPAAGAAGNAAPARGGRSGQGGAERQRGGGSGGPPRGTAGF